jgi:hypothetical protein
MTVDGFWIAQVGATHVLCAYRDRQQAARLAAQIADQLRIHNAAILTGVADLLKGAFSQAKLDQCNSMTRTIATFMNEYNINPGDQTKLLAVEQKACELLDTLSEPDIAVAGITNWMIAASIRILALQEKAKLFPAEMTNAKNWARDYCAYVEAMAPRVVGAIETRFSPPESYALPQPGPSRIRSVAIMWRYSVDTTWKDGFPSEAAARTDRQERLKELAESPATRMTETVGEWRQFADA